MERSGSLSPLDWPAAYSISGAGAISSHSCTWSRLASVMSVPNPASSHTRRVSWRRAARRSRYSSTASGVVSPRRSHLLSTSSSFSKVPCPLALHSAAARSTVSGAKPWRKMPS